MWKYLPIMFSDLFLQIISAVASSRLVLKVSTVQFNENQRNIFLRWRESSSWSGEGSFKKSPSETGGKVGCDLFWHLNIEFWFWILESFCNFLRMVVHDWERKEYKELLNHFTVVEYCIIRNLIITKFSLNILKGRPSVVVALEFRQSHRCSQTLIEFVCLNCSQKR